jgi:hypothetical protein
MRRDRRDSEALKGLLTPLGLDYGTEIRRDKGTAKP